MPMELTVEATRVGARAAPGFGRDRLVTVVRFFRSTGLTVPDLSDRIPVVCKAQPQARFAPFDLASNR